MSSYDTDKLMHELNNKWGKKICPMCGQNVWSVQDKCYELRQFNREGFMVGGPIVPVVPISCQNCGNTLLINALIAGVIDKDKKDE